MLTLPKWMYIDGITYHYREWKGDDNSKYNNLYFCGLYSNNGEGMPPNVKISDGSCIFLCSVATNMEEAREDLLERINSMKYGQN